MVIKLDTDAKRYYTKIGNNPKVYINDARTKHQFKPNTKYLKELEKLLKQRNSENDRKVFQMLTGEIASNIHVSSLLTQYKFTDSDKFRKLYSAVSELADRYKNKIIFDIANTDTIFRKDPDHGIHVLTMTPKKVPNSDDVNNMLKDFFNTAMRTFIKYLEGINKSVWNYKYLIELDNLASDYTDPFVVVEYKNETWSQRFLNNILDRIEHFIISSKVVNLMDLSITVKAYPIPSGGAITTQDFKDSLYKKTSVVKVINKGNCCLWYSLVLLFYQNSQFYKKMIDMRNGCNLLDKLARQMCSIVGFDYNNKVAFDDIPTIIKRLSISENVNTEDENVQYMLTNVAVLNIDLLPKNGITTCINESIMFKTEFDSINWMYLLFDNDHYSPITDIKAFLGVRAFCNNCKTAFNHLHSYKKHEAKCTISAPFNPLASHRNDCNTDIVSDRTQFLRQKKKKNKSASTRYIWWDSEANQEAVNEEAKSKELRLKIHKPNLVVLIEAIINTKCFTKEEIDHLVNDTPPTIFDGYDCIDNFMNHVFGTTYSYTSSSSSSSTDKIEYINTVVLAHNFRGYDGKFILAWAQMRSMSFDIIRNGSNIQMLSFLDGRIKFIDTLNFFQCPLKTLSETFGINTTKGDFPHLFNTFKNRYYKDKYPDIKYYNPGAIKLIDKDGYIDETAYHDFVNWYKQNENNDFDFEVEFKKYCINDVKLLMEACLIYRNGYMDKFRVDPFNTVITVGSLSMYMYRNFFNNKNTIASNTDKRALSISARQWLTDIRNNNQDVSLFEEMGLKINFDVETNTLSTKLFGNKDITVKVQKPQFKEYFQSSKFMEINCTAFNSKTNTLFQFYDDYTFGHPNYKYSNSDQVEAGKIRYSKTIEREKIIRLLGFQLITMWECDWLSIMDNVNEAKRKALEEQAEDENINVRGAFYGGRTEVFNTACNVNNYGEGAFIASDDVSSMYPAVMAFDDYPVGNRRLRKNTTVDDIKTDKFIGIVKCDIECPKHLELAVLPSKNETTKRLMFDLFNKKKKEFSTVELQVALEMGYTITKIYSAYSWKREKGLMKKYVEYFYKMKLCNSKHYSQSKCDEMNEDFKKLGLDITIKSEETQFNPGLKKMAKDMLNNLWGKTAQRPVMTEYKLCKSYQEFLTISSNSNIEITNFHKIHDECLEVHFTRNSAITECPDYVSPITAVFTTANARVRLFRFLNLLHPTQRIYCDTDSSYYLYDPNNPKHVNPRTVNNLPHGIRVGKLLGDWEPDFDDGKEMYVNGPKSYTYKRKPVESAEKIAIRAKGLTIDFNNKDAITFDKMKQLALSVNDIPIQKQWNYCNTSGVIDDDTDNVIQSEGRFAFKTDRLTKEIRTVEITKKLQNTVIGKKKVVSNRCYPWGYEGEYYNMNGAEITYYNVDE